MNYEIKDINLAKKGRLRIEWAKDNMPVLNLIREKFKKEKPLKDIKISCCLHVTSETAVLVDTLKAGGGKVFLCASNPLSTQDDVSASLVKDYKICVFAIKGEDKKTYYRHIRLVLRIRPNITVDDGADLVGTIHNRLLGISRNIMGGTEETTTGVIRLRSLERQKKLFYPIIAVNDAETKFLFDNRYGTGQSTVDGIMRATNKLIAGTNFTVCGYGWCGKGVAMRAKGMGAKVIVVEVDPLRALEAVMDGYQVMPISEAAKTADIFVTTTGNINVITKRHFLLMKDGVILANSGHFNVEIDVDSLKELSLKIRRTREDIDEYTLKSNKRIYLLGEGRLINLAAAEGHPAQVMDMSFSNQALCVEYLVKNHKRLENKVYRVPQVIDKDIACLKLKSLGIKIDNLTGEQKKYLESWQSGT